MRFKFNKKYIHIAIIAAGVLVFTLLVFFLIFNRQSVGEYLGKLIKALNPVIYGLVIAYLFTPLVDFLERRILIPLVLKFSKRINVSKKQKKVIRAVSVVVSVSFVLFLLYILIRSVIPQLVVSVSNIAVQFPIYRSNVENYINEFVSRNADLYAGLENFFDLFADSFYSWFNDTVMPYLQGLLVGVGAGVVTAIKGIWNLVIGAIISIYVLLNKEVFAGQAKKIAYSLFSRERANLLIKDFRFISDTFINFFVGKIVDSLIVGVICFICCSILKFPYPLLISVIVGVTNIIPIFGPFLGAIPSVILIFMVSPIQSLYFIIFILILQQVDGNIIGPKILGDSTGISGFWVIFAITLFGGLWGFVGMFIGIPFFAVIYALVKRRVDRRLAGKEMPVETYEYMPVKRVEKDGTFTKLAETEEDYYQKEKERWLREKEERKASRKKLKLSKEAPVSQNIEELIHYIRKDEKETGIMDTNTDKDSNTDAENKTES